MDRLPLLDARYSPDSVASALGDRFLPPDTIPRILVVNVPDGLELSLLVDNLWDTDFQEVPAVPAARGSTSARVLGLGAGPGTRIAAGVDGTV